jgi:hypothetical protein
VNAEDRINDGITALCEQMVELINSVDRMTDKITEAIDAHAVATADPTVRGIVIQRYTNRYGREEVDGKVVGTVEETLVDPLLPPVD